MAVHLGGGALADLGNGALELGAEARDGDPLLVCEAVDLGDLGLDALLALGDALAGALVELGEPFAQCELGALQVALPGGQLLLDAALCLDEAYRQLVAEPLLVARQGLAPLGGEAALLDRKLRQRIGARALQHVLQLGGALGDLAGDDLAYLLLRGGKLSLDGVEALLGAAEHRAAA